MVAEKQTLKSVSDLSLSDNIIKRGGECSTQLGLVPDPTGKQDSSDAFLQGLNDAFHAQNGLDLLPGVQDLGVLEIDLQGGDYKISKPLRFPPSGANVVISKRRNFESIQHISSDRYLIELWAPASLLPYKTSSNNTNELHFHRKDSNNAGIHYKDITFRDILFGSRFRRGGIFPIDTTRIRIDHCMFIHFITEGILFKRGHETYISSCFLGQHLTVGGDPDENQFSGAAIYLHSNDNVITNVAIFSAGLGALLKG